MNGRILEQDIADFVDKCSYWENLRGKRIAVTGATGLIGSIMIKCLDALNRKHGLGITIYGIARNIDKAKDMFPADVNVISFADFANLEKCLPESKLHYIIHAAAPTASDFLKKKPVETFDGVVGLTRTVLGRAKDLHCESMVLLSSLEFYGEIQDDTQYVTEDCQGYINPLNARSSYSMGKRAAECLCYAFYSEFQIPVKIARLAQTFGAGVAPDDKRVFAYIARLAMGGEDICFNTPGDTKRNYCYTTDAIDATLRILLTGQDGEAYNVANEDTYTSVREMAEMVLKNFSPNNKLIIKEGDRSFYPPTTKVKMSTKKLETLGWKPRYNLTEMFGRLIASIR